MEMWFNPRCSKCRVAKEALDEAGLTYELRYYLDQPPTADELRQVLGRLELEPWEICRTGDAGAAGVDLDLPRDSSARDAWITVMVEHPELIQRPLVVTDDGQAWVARDPESVEAAINAATS
jgi:arsenate reductase (glutaredoxin)